MKTLSFTLILIVVAQYQLFAGNLFREVTARSDSWEVIFHEQGGRYRIEIDSIERGTSGYLQRLRLLPNESLRLVDKHWHMDIKPVDRDGKMGIEITRTYRDRLTGEQKVETTFEQNHQANTHRAEQGDAPKP
ncbi:hypothetical protein OAB00_03290 [Akkermansiaceae bacterium]|nr:hypothetical protein [Akkermansiaceae bacterium]